MSCITRQIEIESIANKALRRFFESGNAKGLVGDVNRLRKMLAFIDAAASLEELGTPPNFGLHLLTGNWRLTFRINGEGLLIDLDLEDYHGA